MSIPAKPIRLRPIEIYDMRVERQTLPEQFRAFCPICQWGGEWRSIWKSWDNLVSEILADINRHGKEVHQINELYRITDGRGG